MKAFRVEQLAEPFLQGYAVAVVMYPEDGGICYLVVVWEDGHINTVSPVDLRASHPDMDLGE